MKFLKSSVLFLIFFLPQIVFAQGIDSIFVGMPLKINPLLDKNSKNKLLFYYKQNYTDSVKNLFGSKVAVLEYDSAHNYISIQNTPSSIISIFTFRYLNQPITGLIKTVGDTLKSSDLRFYKSEWESVTINFKKPVAFDWFKPESDLENKFDTEWIKNQLVVSFVTLKYDPLKSQIVASNSSLKYISKETYSVLSDYFNTSPFVFSFNGREWNRE